VVTVSLCSGIDATMWLLPVHPFVIIAVCSIGFEWTLPYEALKAGQLGKAGVLSMTHDVFISHSTKDKPTADAICHALESGGIRCWIAPRDELAGIKYFIQINQAIKDCSLLVLVFSANANISAHVIREVEIALENSKTVIPYRIEDTPMSVELDYLLKGIHWLDAYPDQQLFDNLMDHIMRNLDITPKQDQPELPPIPAPMPIPTVTREDIPEQTSSLEPQVKRPAKVDTKPQGLPELKPGIKLKRISLNDMSFKEANLKGSNFSQSALMRCNFYKANIAKTDFSNANLEEADLREADIRDSRLVWADMQKADFTGANLDWARLTRADLTNAILRNANLNMVDAREAILVNAQAQNAIFTSALLNEADCQGTDFTGADFRDAVLDDAQLQGANLTGAKNLTAEQIKSAKIDKDTTIGNFQ
jgi:uncharacterized protein YjbI with pentapeptide repeats